MENFERHLIREDSRIVDALERLNRLSGDAMTLFVTDAGGKLGGSLTDGDVRRALLSGHSLDDRVDVICRKDCMRLERGSGDVETIGRARRAHITLLPVIEDGVIVGVFDLRRRRGLVNADGVLMAGGRGERLRPLTEKVPKPLLPVGGKPIIDYNVELLESFGIDRIFVTVNYLKEQIKEHFSNSAGSGGKKEAAKGATCVEEPYRLGTIGSLSLIEGLKAPHVVVMNADLLTDVNLEAMYLKHLETEAWLTMAVVPYTVSVPYAIVEHTGDRVDGLTEKPTYNYFANAGIYMLRREAVAGIPKGEYMDATDLTEQLIREGRRVSLFSLSGRWIDIGSPDDYRHACELTGE